MGKSSRERGPQKMQYDLIMESSSYENRTQEQDIKKDESKPCNKKAKSKRCHKKGKDVLIYTSIWMH